MARVLAGRCSSSGANLRTDRRADWRAHHRLAGPTRGTSQKPVGTAAITVVAPDGASEVRPFSLFRPGPESGFWSAHYAMNIVRRLLSRR
jgi:hypothetical protein